MARTTKKSKFRPTGKFTMLLLALVLVIMGFMLQKMVVQLNHAKSEKDIYTKQLQQLQQENAQLKEDIANSNDPALIQDIARNDLGMISAGEKVFRFRY
ncbi:MAG: septum formation initiator family protein [Oscillospiraceae bacterium]|nr:septum formation initiator family protein [Oscillospiraceae bacterium]